MTLVHIVGEGSLVQEQVNKHHRTVRPNPKRLLAKAADQILIFCETVPQDPPSTIIQTEQKLHILSLRTVQSRLERAMEGSDRIGATDITVEASVVG
jgi:hypothetical protein